MKKVYLILAAAAGMAFNSCTNSEYIGEAGTLQKANGSEIVIGGGAGKMSRAEGAAAATLLGKEMKVYGVKNLGSTNYGKVFVNYSVKYSTAQSGNAEYNDGWYYAGAESGQDIKYWDYTASDYHFAAGSPVANFTYALDATTGDIKTATVTGLGGRLNRSTGVAKNNAPVYVADPVVASNPTNYKQEVNFTFRALQAKVRVGIYETIPGYKITAIQFYNNADEARSYITLKSVTSGYFQGGSAVTGTVTYNWATPAYTFEYGSGMESSNYWEGGKFATGVPAISSTGEIDDLYGNDNSTGQMDGATGYFIVMPTPSETAATDLTIKCDYTLESLDGSGETIHVTGATATIPSTYTKWVANTVYTYLFKITDNTNGSTGASTDPAGLYPITFDAVVVDFEDNKVGTETTVSTPSITCSQNGDVSGNGIVFVAGTNITVNVSEKSDIEVKRLSGAFDYTKSYDAQDYDGASATFSEVTTATIANPVAKTYVIKATSTADATKVAYFVLVVGAAETGQANS